MLRYYLLVGIVQILLPPLDPREFSAMNGCSPSAKIAKLEIAAAISKIMKDIWYSMANE